MIDLKFNEKLKKLVGKKSRGQGLQSTVKYSWMREPNGCYTIFELPIFEPTISGEKKFDMAWIKNAISVFNKKKLNGRYPRAHLGHHDFKLQTTKNQPGAGYMDWLQLKGNTVVADIVGIPPEVFQEIRSGKYPFRSIESLDGRSFTSLALLESREPHFDHFPILILEESGRQFSFQSCFPFPDTALERSESPYFFQKRRQKLPVTKENPAIFQDMPPEKKKEKEDPEEFQDDPAVPPAPAAPEAPPAWVAALTAKLDQILSHLATQSKLSPPAEEASPIVNQNASPEVLQLQKQVQEMQALTQKQIQQNHQAIQMQKARQTIDAKVAELQSQGLVSSEISAKAYEFAKSGTDESVQMACAFLDSVSQFHKAQKPDSHPVQFQSFLAQKEIKEDPVIMQAQQKDPVLVQRAHEIYQKNIEEGGSVFQQSFATPESFVRMVIRNPEIAQKYYS